MGLSLCGLVEDLPKNGLHASTVADELKEVREQLRFCQQLG